MRRIAQTFEAIVIIAARPMFAADQVFDDHFAIQVTNSSHFAQHASWLLHMVEGEAADDHVELKVIKRDPVSITKLEADIRQAALPPVLFGNGQPP